MAGSSPITWQNITGADLGQASRGMALAQQGFNQGFDKLGEVIQKREKMGFDNWDAKKATNTAEFMDIIGKYRTPEEFNAAVASGALDTSRFQAQIDNAAVGAAMDNREGVLQQRVLSGNQYNNSVQDQRDNPIIQQIKGAAASGDALTANIGLNNNPQLRNWGDLRQAVVTGQRAALQEQFSKQDQENKQAAEGRAVVTQEDNIKTSAAQRELLRAQAAKYNAEAGQTKQTGSLEALAKAALKDSYTQSIFASGHVGIGKGSDSLNKGLKDLNVNPEYIKDINERIQKDFPNGIPSGKDENNNPTYIPIPVDFVLRAAAQGVQHWYNFPSLNLGGMGESTTDIMKKMLSDPTSTIHEELATGLDLHNKLYNEPLQKTKFGSHVPTKNPVGLTTPDVAAMQKVLSDSATPKNILGSGVPTGLGSSLDTAVARAAEKEKKSPEIAPTTVVAHPQGTGTALNRAVTPNVATKNSKPSVVTNTEGFSLSNPSKVVPPIDTSKIEWDTANQVVKAGIASRKSKAIVLTVARDGITDGDTIKFADGAANGVLNGVCRIDGIDARETAKPWKKTPEPGQAYGEEAKTVLQKMIADKKLSITVTQGKDYHGNRSVCQIDIQGAHGEEANVPAELIKAGAAFIVEKYGNTPETPMQTAERESKRVFQREAIKNKLGMFGDTNPRNLDTGNPYDYRQRMKLLNPNK